jgi:CheY-like chemotaxis protein
MTHAPAESPPAGRIDPVPPAATPRVGQPRPAAPPAGPAPGRARRPSVVLLDVVMPGMDGWAVLEALRADPDLAAVPVIMVSMLDEPAGARHRA